ncbi:MAG: hypothetical protein K940chlam7_00188 [Chlamydiae bacterium]|nr:hypothetical protein [Chlamydiota bacterium]
MSLNFFTEVNTKYSDLNLKKLGPLFEEVLQKDPGAVQQALDYLCSSWGEQSRDLALRVVRVMHQEDLGSELGKKFLSILKNQSAFRVVREDPFAKDVKDLRSELLRDDNWRKVKVLGDAGADMNDMSDTDPFLYPLYKAVCSNRVDMAKWLVDEKGCFPVDRGGNKGLGWLGLLFSAVGTDSLDTAKWLVDEKGVDPKEVYADSNMVTSAAQSDDKEFKMLKWLVNEKGCDPNEEEVGSGLTPLMGAIQKDRLDTAQWLVDEKGVDPTIEMNGGTTALLMAACGGYLNIVQWLVNEKGCNPNAVGSKEYSFTPLTIAASEGKLNVVKWLVEEKGCDPNARDPYGRTALTSAIGGESGSFSEKHLDVVKWLLEEKKVTMPAFYESLSHLTNDQHRRVAKCFLSDFRLGAILGGKPISELANEIKCKPEKLFDVNNYLVPSANPLEIAFFLNDLRIGYYIKGHVGGDTFNKYLSQLSEKHPTSSQKMVERLRWEINKKHLKATPFADVDNLPSLPEGVFLKNLEEAFQELINNIEFQNREHLWYCSPQMLEKELGGDVSTPEGCRKTLKKLSDDFIQKLREKKSFLATPKEGKALQEWWDRLETMVIHIMLHLQKYEKPLERIPQLLQLAGMGGRCGGIYGEAVQQYKLLFGNGDEIEKSSDSLRLQIHALLQQRRLGILEMWMRNEKTTNVHRYNFFLKCLNKSCGLGTSSYDDEVAASFLRPFYLQKTDSLSSKERMRIAWKNAKVSLFARFLKEYGPSAVINFVMDEVNGPAKTAIDRTLLNSWFQDNIPNDWLQKRIKKERRKTLQSENCVEDLDNAREKRKRKVDDSPEDRILDQDVLRKSKKPREDSEIAREDGERLPVEDLADGMDVDLRQEAKSDFLEDVVFDENYKYNRKEITRFLEAMDVLEK